MALLRADADASTGPAGSAIGHDLRAAGELDVLDCLEHYAPTVQRRSLHLDQSAVAQRSGKHADSPTLQGAKIHCLVVRALNLETHALEATPGDLDRLASAQNDAAIRGADQPVLAHADVRRQQDHIAVAGSDHAIDLNAAIERIALKTQSSRSPVSVTHVQRRGREPGRVDHGTLAHRDAGLVDEDHLAVGPERPEYLRRRVADHAVQHGT